MKKPRAIAKAAAFKFVLVLGLISLFAEMQEKE
jgi:hypothetical protein